MAKRKKGKEAKMLSPEQYIKQKARTLPISECWINKEWEEDGLASIVVARQHTTGNFTIGMYLIDLKCIGVKDAQCIFNMYSSEYVELLNRQREDIELVKIDYTLAHNIIFAGIEYAGDYGFRPHKDFALAKYVLEEDTDEIEIMKISCGGKDGKPVYVRGPLDSNVRAAEIISQLEKTVGLGNFNYMDGRIDSPYEGKHFDDEYNVVEDDDDDIDYDLFDDDPFNFDAESIKNSTTFQFKIQLKNITKPPVWRRVTVPSYYSFELFHVIIQTVFDWFNEHLYSFSPGGFGTWPEITELGYEESLFDSGPDRRFDASETMLSEIFEREGQKYTYIYDFGDNWHHQIILEKIIPEVTDKANCVDGKGKCPPEDCGGVWGYENIKAIMADKTHPEYEEYGEWLELEEGETWDPKEFNLDGTQDLLQELFKKNS